MRQITNMRVYASCETATYLFIKIAVSFHHIIYLQNFPEGDRGKLKK